MSIHELRASSDPLVGKEFAGRYRMIERLGEGGSAVVYRAVMLQEKTGLGSLVWWHTEGVEVAIKIMGAHISGNRSWVERFKLENELLGETEGTPYLIDCGEYGEMHFIVTRIAPGVSMRKMLDDRKIIPPIEALGIIMATLEVVAGFHKKGIVHRDLKPDNLFVDFKGPEKTPSVTVIDLGIGKRMGDNFTARHEPGKNMVYGTPAYMSPEQARGTIGPQADIYALGIVLYEMLAGHPPFEDKLPSKVLAMHIGQPVPVLKVEPLRWAVIAKALEKDLADRFQSCEEFRAACEVAKQALELAAATNGGVPIPIAAQVTIRGASDGDKSDGIPIAVPVRNAPVAAIEKAAAPIAVADQVTVKGDLPPVRTPAPPLPRSEDRTKANRAAVSSQEQALLIESAREATGNAWAREATARVRAITLENSLKIKETEVVRLRRWVVVLASFALAVAIASVVAIFLAKIH